MILFCFAIQGRLPIISDFHHFLQNFGLSIQYDRQNIFFGDHRYQTNVQQGATNPQARYVVTFYSQQFPEGNICLEEFRVLEERHLKREFHIFPIFLDCVPSAIPDTFILCKQLVYKILSDPEDFYRVALHILTEITSDQLQSVSIQKIQDVLLRFRDKQSLLYRLLRKYDNIGKDNYGVRVASLLNILFVAIFGRQTDYMSLKTINFIYHQIRETGLREEKRELQIMENIVFYTVGSIL